MPNNVAYGFHQLQDIFAHRVIDADREIISEALQRSAQAFSEDADAMLALFTVQHTGHPSMRYLLPDSSEGQPLSEDGTPQPRRVGRSFDVAFPIFRFGDSFGGNREVLAKMTVGEMNERVLSVQSAAARWKMRRMLAAIFTNADWTFSDQEFGSLTIRSLAKSGDGSVYINQAGDPTTATHHTAQANAIGNADNPYLANANILNAHPSNSGALVSFIHSDLSSATEGLTAFYPYRNGANTLIDYADTVSLATDMIAQYQSFGTRILGVANGNVIVESPRIPTGYVVTISTGAGAPLAMRRDPEPQLQGLQVVEQQVDSNFRKFDFYMKEGYGVRNPVAIAVRRVGNGSYAIPTGYDLRTLAG